MKRNELRDDRTTKIKKVVKIKMKIMTYLSDIMLPLIIFFVIGCGLASKVKVYEAFMKGAAEGLKVVVDILPTLIGLLVAVSVLRASGFFELLGRVLKPVTDLLRMPDRILPLLIVKMFSSSAATGLLLDIFKTEGPDSYTGMAASILLSSTETIFYTMSVYFIAAKVTHTRYTLKGALLVTLTGTVASILLAGIM